MSPTYVDCVNFWSYSPALDLLRTCDDIKDVTSVNILLVSPCDPRHIIKTISCLPQQDKFRKKIKFYIVEPFVEAYARHMLLLSLAFENSAQRSFEEKSEIFLEIFGNVLLPKRTSEYVVNTAHKFLQLVANVDQLQDKYPYLRLDKLKYAERDFLEDVFKSWKNMDRKNWDISNLWDKRVRNYLQSRYDAKDAVADWDYQMKLCYKDAAVITIQKYKTWRNTGQAFEFQMAQEYDKPNVTLAVNMSRPKRPEEQFVNGYCGDIVSSPYIALGIESFNPELLKTNSEVISQSNVKEMLNNIGIESIKCGMVQVYFLPLDTMIKIHQQSKYQRYFNVIYFSNCSVHHLKPEISSVFSPDAILVAETAKYMLELTKEQCSTYVDKIVELAKSSGCEPVFETSPTLAKEAFLKFIFKIS